MNKVKQMVEALKSFGDESLFDDLEQSSKNLLNLIANSLIVSIIFFKK